MGASESPTPVSYTHLDVYKRQSQNHADTDEFYGAPMEFEHVLHGGVPVPEDAKPFVRTVVRYFHAAQ